VALGGGGYRLYDGVPLAWAWVMAELSGAAIADEVPKSWRAGALERTGHEAPRSMGEHDCFESPPERAAAVLELTARNIRATREAVFPHHGLTP
jgi:acetoin utilization protein AcuC